MKRLGFSLGVVLASSALAQTLDVPFSTACTAKSYSECYRLHEVRDLDPEGDGFLAVRAGPGSGYRTIDRLVNGDQVYVFVTKGHWCGITYRDGRKGWSHKKWLYQIAG